mgnify:CR=1 FL=1
MLELIRAMKEHGVEVPAENTMDIKVMLQKLRENGAISEEKYQAIITEAEKVLEG